MKALATLKNVNSDACRSLIVRNLSRILDIRILDIDIEKGKISFIYLAQDSFNQVKKELSRIGHPIIKYSNKMNKDFLFRNTHSINASNLSTNL